MREWLDAPAAEQGQASRNRAGVRGGVWRSDGLELAIGGPIAYVLRAKLHPYSTMKSIRKDRRFSSFTEAVRQASARTRSSPDVLAKVVENVRRDASDDARRFVSGVVVPKGGE